MKKIAIVTGASGGLGKEFVKLLLNKNELDEIWAIARNQKKLEALKQELGEKIKIYSLDLSVLSEVKKLQEILTKEDLQIKYLVNNAGYDKFGSYKDLSLDESLNMIQLNVNGVVSMGLICIPFMKEGSHIINIASQASFQPMPYQNIYGSTKAFVRNYSRGLNVELKEKKISVTAVCPGWIKTDLYARADIGAEKSIQYFKGMVLPQDVAKKALKDSDKGKDMSVYSFYTKFSHLLAKILPQKTMMKIWLKQQKIK